MKKGYFKNVVNEAYVTGQSKSNIGSELYKLYTDLDPNAQTKSGARVSEVLKMILDDLTETVDFHKRTADQEPWETLQSLFKEIEIGSTPFKRMTSQTNLKENVDSVPFQTNYRFGMSEEECEDGNIVNDAYSKLPYPDYRPWVEQNWDKMSEYEQAVAENIEASVSEGYY